MCNPIDLTLQEDMKEEEQANVVPEVVLREETGATVRPMKLLYEKTQLKLNFTDNSSVPSECDRGRGVLQTCTVKSAWANVARFLVSIG